LFVCLFVCLFVLTSPYTWFEESIDEENWVGAYRKDSEPYSTLYGLKEQLSGHFDLIAEPQDMPFVIRETARKYQYTLAQMTIGRKK
jgi:hypothetical protein